MGVIRIGLSAFVPIGVRRHQADGWIVQAPLTIVRVVLNFSFLGALLTRHALSPVKPGCAITIRNRILPMAPFDVVFGANRRRARDNTHHPRRRVVRFRKNPSNFSSSATANLFTFNLTIFPCISRHNSSHEFIKQRHGECCISMIGAPNHPALD